MSRNKIPAVIVSNRKGFSYENLICSSLRDKKEDSAMDEKIVDFENDKIMGISCERSDSVTMIKAARIGLKLRRKSNENNNYISIPFSEYLIFWNTAVIPRFMLDGEIYDYGISKSDLEAFFVCPVTGLNLYSIVERDKGIREHRDIFEATDQFLRTHSGAKLLSLIKIERSICFQNQVNLLPVFCKYQFKKMMNADIENKRELFTSMDIPFNPWSVFPKKMVENSLLSGATTKDFEKFYKNHCLKFLIKWLGEEITEFNIDERNEDEGKLEELGSRILANEINRNVIRPTNVIRYVRGFLL